MDTRTLALVSVAFPALTTTLSFGVWAIRRVHRGFGAWALSQLAFMAGAAVIAARGVVPVLPSVGLGNTLQLLAAALFLEGLLRFHGLPRRIPVWADAGLIVLCALFFAAAAHGPVNPRLVVGGLGSAWFLGRAAVEPLLDPHAFRGPAQRALSAIMGTAALAGVLRAAHAAATPPRQEYWQEGGAMWAYVLLLALNAVAAGFLVLYLEFERAEARLTAALAEVKTLTGLLPICASCKRVRDDQGYWGAIEQFLATRSDLTFTHGICPTCLARQFPGEAAKG